MIGGGLRSRLLLLVMTALALAASGPAQAYRPFDGTDAAVADPGEVEIELGPARYVEVGPSRTLFAPDLIFNLGIAERWELVLQGSAARSLDQDSTFGVLGNGAFLKGVVREGSLQGMSGPSVATEFGFLLPDINGDPTSGVGGAAALIVSQRWSALTVHVNAGAALTRQQHADVAFSTIVEGPHDWPVRPVTELLYERDFGGSETGSALVGAIWQVRDNVAFDVGLRGGWVDGQPLREVRAGVTFGFKAFAVHR